MDTVNSIIYITTQQRVDNDTLREINKNRLASNPEWLAEKVRSGMIREVDKANILNMAEVLQMTYPDLWDIQITKDTHIYDVEYNNLTGYGASKYRERRYIPVYIFDIIVKFPDIIIKNSKGAAHRIKDLYTSFRYQQVIDITDYKTYESSTTDDFLVENPELLIHKGFYLDLGDFKFQSHIYGKRGAMTSMEYNNGYLHSHLSSSGAYIPNLWIHFCLGSGEIVPTLNDLYGQYNPDLFMMALYQLDVYVKWESLEGGPYRKIAELKGNRDIGSDTPFHLGPNTIKAYLLNVKNIRRDLFINFPEREDYKLNWTIEDNRMIIQDDDDLEKFLKLFDNPATYGNGLILYTDAEGLYYTYRQYQTLSIPAQTDPESQPTIVEGTENAFIFRGENKDLTLYNPEAEVVSLEFNTDYIINPLIKKTFKEKLEAYGNYNKIKSHITDRISEAYYQGRHC